MITSLSTQRRTALRRDSGAGFTLIELMVGLVSSSMLVAGLSSAIYISSQALDLNSSASRQFVIASEVLGDMAADLALARSFSERTATAVTFDVPDRDGDLHPETIRYAWSGTPGDPLIYQYNGGTEITIAADVQSLTLTALTRFMIGAKSEAGPPATVVLEEFTETKLASGNTTISINAPPGSDRGHLLIAALAVDGTEYPITAPAGWNQICFNNQNDRVHFGVWWKIAESSEPGSYTFTWNSGQAETAYGWVMRFTGHDPSSPIHKFAVSGGSSSTPTTPSVSTTVENAFILRLGGFDDDDVTTNVSGINGHTTVTMDESGSGYGTTSGGAAYVYQPTAGSSGTARFALTGSEEYRTVTLAIAPNLSP